MLENVSNIISNENSRAVFKSSKILEDDMPPELKKHFQRLLHEPRFIKYLDTSCKEWQKWIDAKIDTVSFEKENLLLSFINYALDDIITNHKGEEPESLYKKICKSRKNRKDYLCKTIKDEYEGVSSATEVNYLRNSVDIVFLAAKNEPAFSGVLSHYQTEEEYMKSLYEKVLLWKTNTKACLSEFYFFSMLPMNKKFECLFLDMLVYVLSYFVNRNSVDYSINPLSLPTELTDAFFSGHKKLWDVETTVEDDSVINAITYSYEENGQLVTKKTILDEITLEDSKYEAGTMAKQELLELLKKDIKPNRRIADLGNTEFNILVHIYSTFNQLTLKEDLIFYNGKDFVRQVLGVKQAGSREIKKVLLALERLARVRISSEKRTLDGEILSKSIFSFFDLRYGKRESVHEDTSNSACYINVNYISLESAISIDADFLKSDWIIGISPSFELKQAWKKNRNTYIYDKFYKLAVREAGASEIFTMICQRLRLDNPETLELDVPYSYFSNRLKLGKTFLNKQKSEINKELFALKSCKILIKDYHCFEKIVRIKFFEMSEIEKLVYGIADEKTSPQFPT